MCCRNLVIKGHQEQKEPQDLRFRRRNCTGSCLFVVKWSSIEEPFGDYCLKILMIYLIDNQCAQLLSHIQLFAIASLSMKSSKQEYWSGLPFTTPTPPSIIYAGRILGISCIILFNSYVYNIIVVSVLQMTTTMLVTEIKF